MTSSRSPDSPTRPLGDAARIGLMHAAHGDALFVPEATPFSRGKSPVLLSMPSSPISSDSNSSTPLTSSPKSMSSTFDDSAGQWHRSRHSSSTNSTSDPYHPNVLLDDEAYLQLSEYLVQSSDSSDRLSPSESPLNMDGLQIRVIGAPDKSRVETQTRLCIQLLTSNGTKVSSWPYLKLPEHLLARSRLKRSTQQRSASASAAADGTGPLLLSDESKVIYLDAKVVCASQPDQPVKVCSGCIQRERKRAERSKNGASQHKNSNSDRRLIIDDIPEQDRILLFNCGPMVNFSSGDAILPTRITCYCRHHNEKVGFCVEFAMKTDKGETIATGISPPILITDDHKSTRQKGRKRDRSDYEGSSSVSKSRRLPSSSTAPVTPAASRRGSLSPTEAVSPLLADPTELSILDSGPFSSSLPTPGEERAAFGSNTPFFFPPTSPTLNPLDHVDYVAPEHLSTPTLERLVPAQGPTYGGVEVTILGSGFYRGLTCLFGEHHATTVYWNPNTLVCVLPPAPHPGPVVVSFKQHSLVLEGQDVPLFTYYDANDQALLELALQVVGLKTTGKLHDAKHIAMRIVQGGDHNPFLLQSSSSGGTTDDERVISFQQKVIHALDYYHITAKELIRARSSTGHTLLHLAAWMGYDKLASRIVALCHESIYLTDRNGYTALALVQSAMAEDDKRRNRRRAKSSMHHQSLAEECISSNSILTKPLATDKCKPATNTCTYSPCYLSVAN